jgi:hypothetical protein
VSHDPFDLERLRKNWARAAEPEPARPLARRTPLTEDPYVEARELLRRVRVLGLGGEAATQGGRRAALEPFVARAEALVEAMADAHAGPTQQMREELLGVLVDLEDLFDVFEMRRR